jgi:hypothetical protein
MNGLKEVLDSHVGSGIQITLSGKAFGGRQLKDETRQASDSQNKILL